MNYKVGDVLLTIDKYGYFYKSRVDAVGKKDLRVMDLSAYAPNGVISTEDGLYGSMVTENEVICQVPKDFSFEDFLSNFPELFL